MPKKKKVVLDRKTRRAIERMGRPQKPRYDHEAADVQPSTATHYRYSKTAKGSTSADAFVQLPLITEDILPHPYNTETYGWTHLTVFEHLHPKARFLIVNHRAKPNEQSYSQVAFYNARDYNTFADWIETYIAKFGEFRNHDYPPPLDGHYTHACKVKSNHSRIAQWLWIMDNCEGEVRAAEDIWMFADEGDAMLFQLWQ